MTMSRFGMLAFVVCALACASTGGDDGAGGSSSGTGGSSGSGGKGVGAGSNSGGTSAGGTSAGGSNAGGTGGNDVNPDACGVCLEASCAAELAACDANPDCVAMGECYWNCTDDACYQGCYEKYPNAQALDDAIFACVEAKCASECSGP